MVYGALQGLIEYSVKRGLISEDDIFAVRNRLMEILRLTEWKECRPLYGSVQNLLDILTGYACRNGIIDDTAAQRDLLDAGIMGVFTPFPHEVNEKFQRKYDSSPESASEWYYNFSKDLNYVRAERIEKDLKWSYNSVYGRLDITINLSKPEKDPADIAAAKKRKDCGYPKCPLCIENTGYKGDVSRPARQNMRPVKMEIQGEKWYLQYSPYGYFNEHCILLNSRHTPMVIDEKVFDKLFDFLDIFPHYTIGSNADLPIVGGSILSHEHFQGGCYDFPMAAADVEREFVIGDFPGVSAGIVKWPVSVIRLSCDDRKELAEACSHILDKWKGYSDISAGIIAETGGVPHNTVTPIARRRRKKYECDIVLRNNRTSPERPLGIFHPSPELHHIKKENIGLIEVMGLAVLPSRLAKEMELLKQAMLEGTDISAYKRIAHHAVWAKDILERYPDISDVNAGLIIKKEIGAVFERVLSDSGVFKDDDKGIKAFERFLNAL